MRTDDEMPTIKLHALEDHVDQDPTLPQPVGGA
ncbi:MAG: hypothetical protein JWM31_777, partial [Solirubrobacterales bacterium]|nr:hypothetical protein [Solirubrobacterales bacterium]